MEIVLCNLLANAFKYSQKGDQVVLKIRQEEQNCLIEVSDTGKGMPPEKAQQVFERFYQIADNASTDLIGTGIGLSMVKNIVELHQGAIEVETELGQGSSFSLRLPLGSAHLTTEQIFKNNKNIEQIQHYLPVDTPLAVATEPIGLQDNPSPQRLLIVEDNPEIRAFIRSIFRQQFSVQEAENGIQGLAILKESPPDIIISDIMMDGMDGLSFCRKIRAHAAYCHIPVILLTARTSNVYKLEGLDAGADVYVTKPFNAQVLKAQLGNLLRIRSTLKSYYVNRIRLGPTVEKTRTREVVFLEEVIQIIENRMEEDLTAEKLAEAMNMSHSTLYRRIKSYTGESINSFIRSIRLKQAAQLLMDSDFNISQVAYKVGFSDINYFGKCFKQQFKMNPTAFIKSRQEQEQEQV